MRRRSLAVLLACPYAAGCTADVLVDVEPVLVVEPAELALETWVGQSVVREAVLRNVGRAPASVHLDTTGPFTVTDATVELRGGESVRIPVVFSPPASGHFDGGLEARLGAQAVQVRLQGSAAVPPTCPEASDCLSYRFDGEGCVAVRAADGSPCDGGVCLEDARCVGGACVGTAVTCPSDGVECTTAVCNATRGCIQLPEAELCPSSDDPCLHPVCDPVEGCQLVAAPEGSACGPLMCGTRAVCRGGACVQEPVPDGAPCEGLCGPGYCSAGSCVEPPGRPLPLLARWEPPEGQFIESPLRVDANGNALVLVCQGGENRSWPCWGVSIDLQGRERFRVPLGEPRGDSQSRLLLLEDLAIASTDVGPIVAFDPDDGTVRWRSEISTWSDHDGASSLDGVAVGRDGELLALAQTRTYSGNPPAWGLEAMWRDGTNAWASVGDSPVTPIWIHPNSPVVDENGAIYFRGKEAQYGGLRLLTPEGAPRWLVTEPMELFAVADGRLYLREYGRLSIRSTTDGALLAIDETCDDRSEVSVVGNLRVQSCSPRPAEAPWYFRAVDEAAGTELWRLGVDLIPADFSGRVVTGQPLFTTRPSILTYIRDAGILDGVPDFATIHEVSLDGRILRSCALPAERRSRGDMRVGSGRLYEHGAGYLSVWAFPGVEEDPSGWNGRDGDGRGERRAR